MTKKELIERLMNVAENYKKSYLYGTGAMTDIGVLVDEYTETVVKNCSIPDVVGRSEQLCQFERDERTSSATICKHCGKERWEH
jgi:hypothetical protein